MGQYDRQEHAYWWSVQNSVHLKLANAYSNFPSIQKWQIRLWYWPVTIPLFYSTVESFPPSLQVFWVAEGKGVNFVFEAVLKLKASSQYNFFTSVMLNQQNPHMHVQSVHTVNKEREILSGAKLYMMNDFHDFDQTFSISSYKKKSFVTYNIPVEPLKFSCIQIQRSWMKGILKMHFAYILQADRFKHFC
jgi:hypothetical protein